MLFAIALAYAASRASVTLAATAAKGAAPTPLGNEAAIDQYFGPMKMSALGIREKVDALGRRYHARTITDEDLVHDASLVESSFYPWQKQFPRDPWIVPTAYHLEQLYQAVQSTEARAHATALLHFIADTYPKSTDARLVRLRLAQGFPPLHAESATHATPNPYAASPAASAIPSDASSSPGAAAAPSAGPSAGPSAAPAPLPTST